MSNWSTKISSGRARNEGWVVGGIVRNVFPRTFFLKIVENRCMETLTNVVINNVNENSIIITDKWGGYNDLVKNNYIHLKINHSKNFVDPFNPLIHRQNIENLWKQLRKFLSKSLRYSRKNINIG